MGRGSAGAAQVSNTENDMLAVVPMIFVGALFFFVLALDGCQDKARGELAARVKFLEQMHGIGATVLPVHPAIHAEPPK